MSNPTDIPVITSVPETQEETPESVEKLTFVTKTKTFVKNHKRPAIAVGALVGLVGLAALAGKKEPLPGFEATLELEPPHASIDVDIVEQDDTATA